MPLPASIRSVKARLRTLNEPDFWSSVVGLVLLMPLGWQIINHLQQPSPEAKTPKPTSDLNATESIKSESPTANSTTAADIDNSAVLDRLLAGGAKSKSSVSALPASSSTPTNGSGVSDQFASSGLDTAAILERFSAGSSTTAMTPTSVNPDPSAIAYTPRSSMAQDILLSRNLANTNATLPSALQTALEKSAEREVPEVPSAPQPLKVEESIALAEPPSPPMPSTPKLPTSPPSSTPSTSLLPLPTPPLPTAPAQEPVVLPTPNTLPPSLNPMPTPTQQTKLYPYIPERVYSSPLPALPPSPTRTNLNNNGLPPLPNPGISPQSQNLPTNPTVAETIQPTGDSRVELQPVPFGVERSIRDGEIQPSQPTGDSPVKLPPAPLAGERSLSGDEIQPSQPTGDSRVELQPAPFGMERLIGGGEMNTFANP
jgi:hypothetical protein